MIAYHDLASRREPGLNHEPTWRGDRNGGFDQSLDNRPDGTSGRLRSEATGQLQPGITGITDKRGPSGGPGTAATT